MKKNNKYYKALKEDLTSIGLKRSLPIKYYIRKWVYPREAPQYGEFTKGGLWVSKNKHFIKWLRRYVLDKYRIDIRVFECYIGITLFETSNRIKTDKVKLLKEIEF